VSRRPGTLLAAALACVAAAAPTAAACSVCFSATDENRNAFLGTTVFLSLLPLALLAGLAWWAKHGSARPEGVDQPAPSTASGLAQSPLLWSVALLSVFAGLAVAVEHWDPMANRPVPEVLLDMPAFSLTDQEGDAFGTEQLAGQPWVANFIFTSCPSVCPGLTMHMRDIQDHTVDIPQTHLVSFSVDPDTDTPEVLHAYGERFGADCDRWSFLTGSWDAIRSTVVEGFKMAMDDREDVNPAEVLHGTRFVLLDGQSRIRGYYDVAVQAEKEALEADLRLLAQLGDAEAAPAQ
jgi:protein SCO1/2